MKLQKSILGLPLFLFVLPVWASDHSNAAAAGMVMFLVFLFALIILYLVPIAVAQYRQSTNILTVVLVNLFLGWTGIGWIVALILAFAGDSGKQALRHRQLLDALNRNQNNPTNKP